MIAAAAAGLLAGDPRIALSAGYGALIMLAVNGLLAHRISAWSRQEGQPNRRSVGTAAARFAMVALLLVAAFHAGLWLPAVAGGMLVAQLAVYVTGFLLLVKPDEIRQEKKDTEGETV